MKRICFFILCLWSLALNLYAKGPKTISFSVREAEITLAPLKEFIADVVVPVCQSFNFNQMSDEISVEFSGNDINIIVIPGWEIWDTKQLRDLADKEIDIGGEKEYVTFIDGLPVYLQTRGNNKYIDIKPTYRRMTMKLCMPLIINDDEARWIFKMVDGDFVFVRLSHFDNDWILDKPYMSLLPKSQRTLPVEIKVPDFVYRYEPASIASAIPDFAATSAMKHNMKK